ncbi:unnamed protein product [Camellia sinensis]
MAGCQAFIAFKDSNSAMTVKTFNISSYRFIVPSNLFFDVTAISIDSSGGMMRIFAMLTLSNKTSTTPNQVRQVKPAVTDGFPNKHDFQPTNLNSKEHEPRDHAFRFRNRRLMRIHKILGIAIDEAREERA